MNLPSAQSPGVARPRRPSVTAAVLAAGCVAVVALAACNRMPWRMERAEVPAATRPMAIVGKLVCLPLRTGEPVREECALGLEDDSFRYYQLRNPEALVGIPENSRVAIAGTFEPSGHDRYMIVGVLDITSVARL